ncbi:glucose-6-phosphate isomerase [Rhizohabitans arisaemae]|uniref:glucose-6-phosphate isomerase n=1 Tax=Rhizohabitans arisaemae TaxID=2720610 RepID=UPI0024B267FD|nr:glucose-6-phosphate isomerase [Rhizohabitans arisaemae]
MVEINIGDADLAEGAAKAVGRLAADGVPSALAAGDPTLWGPAAQAEAAIRLGWIDLAQTSRDLLPVLDRVKEANRGLDHVVLSGMGGSSLAPEVICATEGVPLTVVDTTDPGQVRRALADRLDRTVLVVSSKSGGTVETDSHRRIYEQAFRDAGIDPADRIVVVTDPGSPLEEEAERAGYLVVLADPNVGGRYSALTAFGLVPSALAGADVARLLDEAAAVHATLGRDEDNPALTLGAALGASALAGRDKLVLADAGSGITGLGDWVEQLIAESTGKQGRGLLPVVVESASAFTGAPDALETTIGRSASPLSVSGPLGAQFLAWEYATAVAGRMLGIDPFDQPNVAESKENTARLLESGFPEEEPVLTDGPVQVFGYDGDLSGGLPGVLRGLLGAIPEHGYLAIMAYLDRQGDAQAARLRAAFADRTPHAVTFGWGPRFLHSTGQYHKGGPQNGVFLQITGAVADDLPVPGRPFTLGRLQTAQALGDLGALRERGRPAVRLHLTDRAAGLARLLEAL